MDRRNQNDIDLLNNSAGRYDARERAERLSRNRQGMLENSPAAQKSAAVKTGAGQAKKSKRPYSEPPQERAPRTVQYSAPQTAAQKTKKRQSPVRTAPTGEDGQLQTRSERAKISAQNRKKRKKRREIFIILIALAMLAAFICILSTTVLFNTQKIVFENSAGRYTDEQLLAAAEIAVGDNMVRMPVKKLESKIETVLPYIENAVIKRSFPDTVVISVEYAAAALAVKNSNGCVLMSATGKVLENGAALPDSGVTLLSGVEILSCEAGKTAQFSGDGTLELCLELEKALSDNGIEGVSAIDISNRSDIKLEINGRISVLLGSASNINGRLAFGKEVIEKNLERAENAKLVIDLSEDKKAYVRTQENIDKMNESENATDNNSEAASGEQPSADTQENVTDENSAGETAEIVG